MAMSPTVAHALWDHYEGDESHELILFHSHPMNPLNLLVDNLPRASTADRRVLGSLVMNPQ